MQHTVLLVGHGSRALQGNIEIEAFAEQWRAQHPDWRIEVCFIEFADVLLDAGFDLAAKGSKKVIVVPLILNAAGHVKMEIPEYLVKAKVRHPQVEFIYAAHIGASTGVLTILKRSLQNVMSTLDAPDPKTTGVIVLGRGSSDKVANGEVAKMARWLWEDTQHELVDIAFTGITFPRLETAVQRQVKLGMTQICILPYYLFTGTLINRISKQFERLQSQYPQISFGLGQYFGFEPEIFASLDAKVLAVISGQAEHMMECDGCSYRQFAQDHGQGHQH
ncbi:MAG: sirohydrochlorin cobaltochelatase [Methyloprofundus sp.]|nr:MAG: sirohydrochlorin cobaltochelatase [Methyloprofundus sp.]